MTLITSSCPILTTIQAVSIATTGPIYTPSDHCIHKQFELAIKRCGQMSTNLLDRQLVARHVGRRCSLWPPQTLHYLWRLHTPCTDCAAARADRCWLLRTPCTHCGSAHADRCWLLRTPCTHCGSAHADRCWHLPAPCSARCRWLRLTAAVNCKRQDWHSAHRCSTTSHSLAPSARGATFCSCGIAQQQLFLDLGSSRTGGTDLARLLAVVSGAASSRKRLGRHLARDAGAGGSTCFRENCFLHVFSLRQNSQRQKPRVIRSTMIQTLIAAQVHCRTYSLQHWLTASSHRS